jgi:hypothetical protein
MVLSKWQFLQCYQDQKLAVISLKWIPKRNKIVNELHTYSILHLF